jgi:tannase/feruloyl esterase
MISRVIKEIDMRILVFASLIFTAPLLDAASCESLSTLPLPDTTITLAKSVPEGGFAQPGPGPFNNLPAFCRVAATLKPTSDSLIKIEVWMPASGWNGNYEALGNGGWAGSINFAQMAPALRRGYAISATDDGNPGPGGSGSFVLNHPERLIDFAYRAEHEMAVKSKAIIAAFYGKAARRSYWFGCSSGGKEALKEAQKFPEDFDGIVAGAPANYWTHLMAGDLWVGQATLKDPASYIPPAKYPTIHKAVIEACDALDGVKDGVLSDPTRCRFDPGVLQCRGRDSWNCLTAPQVAAARKIYGGAKNPRTGQQIFPGLEPGSEMGWGPLAGGPKPFSIVDDHFKFVVFKNPNWDFRTLNFDTDIALADKIDNGTLNATDPDLKAFQSRGGKLIQYHGWNDMLIAPRNSINYYNSVADAMGGAAKTAGFYRLFMAPGVNHCGGGDGPDNFDLIGALDEWVEKDKAPEQILAWKGPQAAPVVTRPLCPYPQVAEYKGSGSSDDAQNFVCKMR